MKHYLLIFFIILNLTIGCATVPPPSSDIGEIKGYISDANTNEGLVSVKVEILGTNNVTQTGIDGGYCFQNISPGRYRLRTSYITYIDSISPMINVISKVSTIVNFTLKVDTIEVNKIKNGKTVIVR